MKYIPLSIACLFLVLTVGAIIAIADCTDCSSGPAPGTAGTITFSTNSSLCREQFPQLPALADRLGVKSGYGPQQSAVLSMCDGTVYDLFALVNAFLDRMEKQK